MEVAEIPVSLENVASHRLALPKVGRVGTSKLPPLCKKFQYQYQRVFTASGQAIRPRSASR